MISSKIANALLWALVAVCLLVLAYLLISFGLTIFQTRQWLYYYLPVIVTLIFLLLALRLKTHHKTNLVIAFAATVITLYILEGGLTWLHWSGAFTSRTDLARAAAAEEAGIAFDTRTGLEVIDQLAQQGIASVPFVSPIYLIRSNFSITLDGHEALPLAGISNALTVYCNENGAYVTYQSDEHGFRNPPGLYGLDRLDIAIVGDSFAHGACVKTGAETAALIRQVYPKTLNLGFGNNGPLTELAGLKEFAAPLKPGVVLWFYYEGNDLVNLAEEKLNKILMNYLVSDFRQELSAIQSELDRQLVEFVAQEKARERQKESLLQRVRRHPVTRFIVLAQLRRNIALVFDRPDDSFDAELFGKVLATAQTLTASWNGQLYFVYLPEWQRFSTPGQGNPHREEVLQIVRKQDIPIIDLYPVFAAQPDPLSFFPFRLYGHYNEAGYRLVADTILARIGSDPSGRGEGK